MMSGVTVGCLLIMAQAHGMTENGVAFGSERVCALRVHMPREVTIEDDSLELGEVSVILGREFLVKKASNISLGRISVPGQKIVLDRSLILSRLACNGIPAEMVRLTGAESVTVRKHQQIVRGDELVELASSFLKGNPPSGSICELTASSMPQDVILPGQFKDVKLSPSLVGRTDVGQLKVRIRVVADDTEVAAREIGFRTRYNHRRAVTLADIPAGTVIRPENVKIEESTSSIPEPVNWKPPYGLAATRRLRANTVITEEMVGAIRPDFVVKRNETVVIRIDRPALLVTAVGKAMEQARPGDIIKVRNVDSQRLILCRVKDDGTVEPVF